MKAEVKNLQRYELKTDDTLEVYEWGVELTIRIPLNLSQCRNEEIVKQQKEALNIALKDTLEISVVEEQ